SRIPALVPITQDEPNHGRLYLQARTAGKRHEILLPSVSHEISIWTDELVVWVEMQCLGAGWVLSTTRGGCAPLNGGRIMWSAFGEVRGPSGSQYCGDYGRQWPAPQSATAPAPAPTTNQSALRRRRSQTPPPFAVV